MSDHGDDETRSERRERGLAALARVNPRVESLRVVEEASPDFAAWILEFAYGDVFSRPGLDLKSRELVIIAALVTLGVPTFQGQLESHILGALRAGATRTEITEAILQLTVYVGFPAAQNALFVAKKVFDAQAESAATQST